MNSHDYEENEPLHFVTPLKYSKALSEFIPGATELYIKLENCQPSGSYKIRGVGRLARKLKERGCQQLVSASGGNAGVAAAYASRIIDIPCTVYVPQSTEPACIKLIKDNGAQVKIVGSSYSMAEEIAIKEAENPGIGFLSPYNHAEIWAGNSTMMDELKVQLPSKPSTIVLSVGGGGLLLGVLKGLERLGWQDVPVVAMETFGAHCFNLSVKAKKIVALEKITSIAKCLGARTVAPHLLEILPHFNIISEVVTDAQAVRSCIKFADDEHILVEPGCGATLSAVYCGVLEKLQTEGVLPHLTMGPVVVIVCGGNSVSLSLLKEWAENFNVPFP
ncbi:L-serine dehydratase/L-threonine deaminase [Cryptotermes secundus]|uniref:L-serine ammonia-lyase n=1 Tax=Cryptotermes secundus TaxID=105785 RepID=A0A2J7R9G1_9NEOP|nr:L-serine dehydratase/L-threonine deaminase [Cryptotermes secundus]PNF37463.1 L-serine dehydratase/L-threonine deaminase [Cryptotermes secundus]